MELAQRIRLVLGLLVLLVLGAFALAFLVTAFVVLAIVGAVLALVLYVRLRLLARRVRRALEQAHADAQARQGQPPRGPGGGGAIDADFKVDK